MNNIDILRQYEPLWGHWRLGECIGSGAQSQVYSVTDEDGNSGALKVMSVDKACEEGAVVQEQLQLTESLSDVQGVVPCLKTGEFSTDEGTLAVILMPKLTPLNTLMMEREEEFSISEVLKIGRDLCSALEECRKLSIIHRDIKPANVFCDDNGNYCLGDFGVARSIEHTMLVTGKGTPAYISPELASRKPCTYSSDMYSLGIMLYQLLNDGRLPLLEKNARYTDIEEAVAKRLTGAQLPLPENAQNRLGQLICDMCAHEPKHRPTPTECIEQFDKFSTMLNEQQAIPPARRRIASVAKCRLFVIALAALISIAAVLLLLVPDVGLCGGSEKKYPEASIPTVNAFASGGVAADSEWLYFGADADDKLAYRINRSSGERQSIYDGSMTYMNICGDRIFFTASNTIENVERLEDGSMLVYMREGVRSMNIDGSDERMLCDCNAFCAVEYDGWIYHYIADLDPNGDGSYSAETTIMRVSCDGSAEEKVCELPGVYTSEMYVYRDRIYLLCRDYSGQEKKMTNVVSLTLEGEDMRCVIEGDVGNIDFYNDSIYYTANKFSSSYLMKKSLYGDSEEQQISNELMSLFCICDNGIVYNKGANYFETSEEQGLFLMSMNGERIRKLMDENVVSMQFAGEFLVVKTTNDELYMLDITSGEKTVLDNFSFEIL